MSRTTILLTIAALMVSAAFAQSTIDAPLLPLYNFVQKGGLGSTSSATTAVAKAGIFAFTSDSKGVWGMNATGPAMAKAPFYDALPGVTQLIPLGNWSSGSLIAIAGSTIALYKTNLTAVWREATFETKNATFDIRSDSNGAVSNIYPAFVQDAAGAWAIVLGTQNTSNVPSGTHLPSTIYALRVADLSVLWSVVSNSDTTNFGVASDATFVWFLAQNLTTSYTDYVVQKIYIVNGSLSSYYFDTGFGYTSLAYLSVANGQLFVQAYYGNKVLLAADGTELMRESGSAPSCPSMPYQPVLVNGSWVVVCGYYLYEFNNVTGAKTTSFYTSTNYIRCGAIASNGDLVFVAGATVYVRNASGIVTLATIGTNSLQCSGATFGPSVNMTGLKGDVSPADIFHITGSNAVVLLNYRTGEILAQIAGDLNPLGVVTIDLYLGRVFVASTNSRWILQGYDFVPIRNATSFVADFTDDYSAVTFAIAFNATNQSTYYLTSRTLWTVDRFGNAAKLGSFNNYIEVEVQPTIIGQYLVIVDTYYGKVYVYDSVKQSLSSGVDACYASRSVQPIVTGTKFIFFCSSQNSYGSTAANLVDVTTGKLDSGFLPKSSSSYPYGLGGAVVDDGKTLILATSMYELRAFDISKSPASTTTALWTLSRSLGTTSGFLALTSLPAVYKNKFYFTAMGYVYLSSAGSQSTLFSVPATGLVSTVSLTTELVLGKTNSDAVFKTLSVKSGGAFGSGILYVIGSANITAVSLSSTQVLFNYKHNGTIMSTMQGTPAVLDNSGAICFFDSNSNFAVVGGFEGGLAWTYPTLATNWYAPLTDNTSVYFSDGYHVVGANIWSGAVSSVSTYGTGGGVQGFALAAGQNVSTVVAATSTEYVYAEQVWSYYGVDVTGRGTNPSFPGSGSASGNGGGSDSSSSSGSKAWIAGVVIAVIVVIAIVVVIAKKGGSSGSQDDNYVPMNPATQV